MPLNSFDINGIIIHAGTADSGHYISLVKTDGWIEFNDAEVKCKIGRRTKNVSWNEFENIVGVHDISEELHSAYKRTNNFVGELTKLSDKYYNEIIKSGVVDDE